LNLRTIQQAEEKEGPGEKQDERSVVSSGVYEHTMTIFEVDIL